MPSMTSFSGEIASICIGVFVASILIVPALLVAYSADPGKRKVSSLKTIVVFITLSSANAFPSCIAETSFQVPCSPSKSFLDAGSGGLSAAINDTTAGIMSNRAFIMISEPELLCNQRQAGNAESSLRRRTECGKRKEVAIKRSIASNSQELHRDLPAASNETELSHRWRERAHQTSTTVS